MCWSVYANRITRLHFYGIRTCLLRQCEQKLKGRISKPSDSLYSYGVLVRSKSEVIVADTLTRLGISYDYEKRLLGKSGHPNDFRLPDFTISYEGDTFYWEHLGMLSVPSYREQWERKKAWYEKNGYLDRLITSEDGHDGSINSTTIEKVARERILG